MVSSAESAAVRVLRLMWATNLSIAGRTFAVDPDAHDGEALARLLERRSGAFEVPDDRALDEVNIS